jgi:hypothetical protein
MRRRLPLPGPAKAASAFAVLVLTGCGLAGCGSPSGRGDAATAVALRLLTAVDADDGATACATLAPDTLAELESSAEKPCATAVLEEDLPAPATVDTVDVYGQWARVVLSDDTMFLATFPGGWRVVAAGCSPRDRRPYDCVLRGG